MTTTYYYDLPPDVEFGKHGPYLCILVVLLIIAGLLFYL